ALWGCLLGLIIRQQVVAVVVMLLSTWLVSGGLQRLVPEVGRFTIDEAMAAVYQDSSTAGLLPTPWAIVVLAAWIAAAAVAGRAFFVRRDLP
ncbi:ABC transporter permease, partial [Streptomyces sp. NPDC002690]